MGHTELYQGLSKGLVLPRILLRSKVRPKILQPFVIVPCHARKDTRSSPGVQAGH